MLLIEFLDFSSLIVVQQDGIIEIALLAHHGSTNLAESYSVSPSGANQFEALRNTVFICIIFIYHEGRALSLIHI